MTPYERTHLSRNRTAGAFPFPELRPSLDYCICEFAGELRDAVLRDERTADKRNTDKAHDERSELGDSFFMLLSACIRADHAPHLVPIVGIHSFRRECNEITRLLTHAADYAEQLEQDSSNESARIALVHTLDAAYSYMAHLCQCGYGWDVGEVVEDACAKFERKHAAEVAA
jgi:hypothetical protein